MPVASSTALYRVPVSSIDGWPLLILQATTLPAACLALFLLLCLRARFSELSRLLILFQYADSSDKLSRRRLSASRSTELQPSPNRSPASPLSANLPSHQKRIAGSSIELRTTDERSDRCTTHTTPLTSLSVLHSLKRTFFPRHFTSTLVEYRTAGSRCFLFPPSLLPRSKLVTGQKKKKGSSTELRRRAPPS